MRENDDIGLKIDFRSSKILPEKLTPEIIIKLDLYSRFIFTNTITLTFMTLFCAIMWPHMAKIIFT